MVELIKLYPGCKVKIVDKWVTGCHQNPSGQMDRWLGQIMTVDHVSSNYVYMIEDKGYGPIHQGNRWRWLAPSISDIVQDLPQVDDLI